METYTFIVIGGGIAGVTCVENLSTSCPKSRILLISASSIIKSVINFKQLTRALEQFEVVEKSAFELTNTFPNITVLYDELLQIDPDSKKVKLVSKKEFYYIKLCICTGGTPKLIVKDNPYVIGIRDTESVVSFESKLKNARKIMIIGNGGIATELVFKIEGCDIIWAVKDSSIISTFVDAGAAHFLFPYLFMPDSSSQENSQHLKRLQYQLDNVDATNLKSANVGGCALGPDWTNILNATSMHKSGRKGEHIQVQYNVEVKEILTASQFAERQDCHSYLIKDTSEMNWPVYVKLSNDQMFGVDFVVSATGVVPLVPTLINHSPLVVAEDGGVCVNEHMQTSVENIFAAGDACHAAWQHSPLWQQMRLWDQARQMGYHAAQCMQADLELRLNDLQLDFAFELFAHVTKFFDHKIVLLGKFNGQGLPNDYKILVRVIEGKHYVKAVLREGRLVGGVLVGETDLEETFENLMLNQLDLTRFGDDLLNQDIEDFFD